MKRKKTNFWTESPKAGIIGDKMRELKEYIYTVGLFIGLYLVGIGFFFQYNPRSFTPLDALIIGILLVITSSLYIINRMTKMAIENKRR